MTAVVVIALALLVGVGLVVSQLARLRAWLNKAPPEDKAPPQDPPES